VEQSFVPKNFRNEERIQFCGENSGKLPQCYLSPPLPYTSSEKDYNTEDICTNLPSFSPLLQALSEYNFSVLLGIYFGVRLLGHMVFYV
jgi:hypothetical protein